MELQRQDFDQQPRTTPGSGVEQFHLVGLNGTRMVVAAGEIDMASAPGRPCPRPSPPVKAT